VVDIIGVLEGGVVAYSTHAYTYSLFSCKYNYLAVL